ncbi:MAG: alpha-glucan family phosphorylase [Candidatus Levybacteria bacterium]|nr:alpha-glucan family phosphorylase [Candidatus Levybacteria bacterium]
MNTDTDWFASFRTSKEYALLFSRPIAYFSAEYAFFEHEQTYAGGLGVLAGDFLREASDQELPVAAVGLYYKEGYLYHEAFSNEAVLKHTITKLPEEVGLIPVVTETGERVIIEIPMADKTLYAQAWLKKLGSVSLYLLDTNISQNDVTSQNITQRLYTGDKEIRFKQEMVLGIGGMRLLHTLNINPIVYHLNEGHSALLSYEILHHEMTRHKKGFLEAITQSKQRIVFTNHTLIAAGNDTFSKEMVSALLMGYAQQLQIPVEDLLSLGIVQDTSIFSMTSLALRMAGKVNAVSNLHAQKAAEIWSDHTMMAVTNGIHIPTWNCIKNDERLIEEHAANKKVLLSYIAEKTGQQWKEETILLGWARRMVAYKRPLALFEDIQRFIVTARNKGREMNVVLAGQAHESDEEGGKTLAKLQEMITNELKGTVVYLPHYTMSLAKMMTSGTDVWLNTPVVGFEACGTSGMKACLNGSLPCTTDDGWIHGVNLYGIGWMLNSDHINQSLLDTLEKNIVPLYYDQKQQWQENMKHSRELIFNEFTATKMLRHYIEFMYKEAMDTQHI